MADFETYYSPYQPVQVPGGIFAQAAASAGFNYGASAMGGAMTPMGFPGGYSNPMTYASRMSQDKFFSDMMQQAAYRDKMNFAQTWSPVAGGFMNAAGKQVTQQQMDTFLKFSQQSLAMANPMMMSSPTTRYMMDLGAGGNSESNIAFGLTNIRKQFRDPFALSEHLSSATANVMAEQMYADLYGNSSQAARFNNSGFRAGEQVDIMNWAQSKGWMGSPMALRRGYSDPYTMASALRGDITTDSVEAAGRGDLADLLGDDLSSQESKELASRYAGSRMANNLQDADKALRAVKDIFEKSDIFMTANELFQATDRMTARYGQQMTGERIGRTLRVTNQIARNLKLGAQEQGVMGDLAAGVVQQYGYESAFETGLVQNSFLLRKSMRDAGVFENKSYGMMNEEQAMQASMQADAAYGKEQYANRVAVLERLRQKGVKADDPLMQQYMQELESGSSAFSDDSIFRMTEAEFEARVAKMRDASGNEVGGATVDMMMQQDFANEKVTHEKDLLRYRTQAQREDLYNTDFAYNAQKAYGAQFGGIRSDPREMSKLTEQLSRQAYDITMHAGNMDGVTLDNVASEQLTSLEAAAASGNKTAQAMLDKLGKDRPTRLNAMKQYNETMFAEQGNYQNNVAMLNQGTADAMRSNLADAEAGAWLESSLAGQSSGSLGDSFINMAKSLKEKGLGTREALYSAVGNLVNAKEQRMTEDQIHEAVDPIANAYDEYDLALEEAEKNGASPEIKAQLAAKKAALGGQLDKLHKEFGAYAPRADQEERDAMHSDAAARGQAGPMDLSMTGVTIIINGVEIGNNLTAEGKGRRTEVPV